MIREVGDAARTRARWPPMVTVLASASPQKPWPAMSKRSLSEVTRGAVVTAAVAAAAGAAFSAESGEESVVAGVDFFAEFETASAGEMISVGT